MRVPCVIHMELKDKSTQIIIPWVGIVYLLTWAVENRSIIASLAGLGWKHFLQLYMDLVSLRRDKKKKEKKR